MPDSVDDPALPEDPTPRRRARDWGDEEDADRRRRREDEDDYDDDRYERRRRRSDYYDRPHRGGLVLTLGILSVVMCNCCPYAGVGLGGTAWVMGNNDLAAMDAGEMDPAGRSNTAAGRVCGMVAGIGNAAYSIVYTVYIVAMLGLG